MGMGMRPRSNSGELRVRDAGCGASTCRGWVMASPCRCWSMPCSRDGGPTGSGDGSHDVAGAALSCLQLGEHHRPLPPVPRLSLRLDPLPVV